MKLLSCQVHESQGQSKLQKKVYGSFDFKPINSTGTNYVCKL